MLGVSTVPRAHHHNSSATTQVTAPRLKITLKTERPAQLSLGGSSSCGYDGAAMCGLVAWPPSLPSPPEPRLPSPSPTISPFLRPSLFLSLSLSHVTNNQQSSYSSYARPIFTQFPSPNLRVK